MNYFKVGGFQKKENNFILKWNPLTNNEIELVVRMVKLLFWRFRCEYINVHYSS